MVREMRAQFREVDVPDTEELSCSSAEGDVRASEVVDGRLGEHGVVLELGLTERRAVAGNQDKLSWSRQGTRGEKGDCQHKGPSQPHAPVPGERVSGRDEPLPERICLRADLYPREYLPDLTTRARREAMDSEDFAALDFLVGAIADGVSVSGVGVLMLQLGRRARDRYTEQQLCSSSDKVQTPPGNACP